MSTITETAIKAYRIKCAGEWATIMVEGWQSNPAAGATQEQGEILIHSSYGNWGYQWTNAGASFKRFLAGLSFDYMMGKMMPGRLREFDFEASLASWKRHLVAARRSRSLTADEFREIWDESCAYSPCSIDLFMDRIERSRPHGHHDHPLWDSINAYAVCRYNVQAVRFWEDLWPKFVAHLLQESVAANESCQMAAG